MAIQGVVYSDNIVVHGEDSCRIVLQVEKIAIQAEVNSDTV